MTGHGLKVLCETYAHVIEELRGQPPEPAEKRIADARRDLACVKNVPKAQSA
jgi:hypothetical protein